jgi:hypothetical protein
MGPLLILLAVAAVITILLIRMVPWTCFNSSPQTTEGFTLPDVKNCPYGSVEYIDAHDVILCCDGKVEGKECLGKDICRFSPTSSSNAPPHCVDYVSSQAFDVDGSMIQNPDTNMCMSSSPKYSIVVMADCDSTDKTQQWTYNKLGQLVNYSVGKCMEEVYDHPVQHYKMKECQLKDSQIFKYDYKKNTLYSAASPNSPLFSQDSSSSSRQEKLVLATRTDDEIKAAVKKLSGREMSEIDLQNTKKDFYTDRNKPQRTTFIAVKPTFQELMSSMKNIF